MYKTDESYVNVNCEWVIEVTDKILNEFELSTQRKVNKSVKKIYKILSEKSYSYICWHYGRRLANEHFRASKKQIKADFTFIWHKIYDGYWSPASRGFRYDDEIELINKQAKLIPDGEMMLSTTHSTAINHWIKDINKDKETK